MAWHLAALLSEKGEKITQVISRNEEQAKALAQQSGAESGTKPSELRIDVAVCFIAVHDNAIASVASELPQGDYIVAHTSGSVGMDALKRFENRAVFYPLQSLRKNKRLRAALPLCIEAATTTAEDTLTRLASAISNEVCYLNSAKRQLVHLAAVFAGNFTNHMYTIAGDLMRRHGISFELLRPLIEETAGRISDDLPEKLQTGPAIRGDSGIMEKHLELLAEDPDYKKIYNLVSRNIQRQRKNRDGI